MSDAATVKQMKEEGRFDDYRNSIAYTGSNMIILVQITRPLKEAHNMIFTSNKNPALWREDFNEDTTLLCALDRIFDDAMVFKLRGESFRGKKLETISLQTGKVKAVESVTEMKG